MKMEQNTTQTSPALLRIASGVDTPETNSLCCAAAGIIAPLNATGEARIPHEKLRGAGTSDATLIAQNVAPAQPVVGYTHLSSDQAHPQLLAGEVLKIDERAEYEKEFPIPEGLQYCPQRGTYIKSLGASSSDNFALEHYAYRAGFAAWKRRAWKQSALEVQSINHVAPATAPLDAPV
ncbi:hypothetical protein [Pseudomonas sp. C2B4]|uniref:hypothetical protein n=1 Tax=Pseudomonas sp. C2B4 TaxID=2735270 RepID=UPI001586F3EB|nr:hypothetical protein [Pseudomonas sp. C2B4]